MSSLSLAHENHHQNIRIPLSLAWGDLPQSLEIMAKPGGFTIVNQEEVGDKTIITVHGLLGTALKETLFIYKKNSLVEIEYRYGNPGWKKENFEAFFNSFRRMYDEKYGAGSLLTQPSPKKNNPPEITTSLLGYEWGQASCNLDLFLFSAEDFHQSYRLISLHYKAP
ncbi:MAG: hypothetical protein K2W99_04525 [Chthoniobacterales bacterium]|nr:hypothetical protein [Chthoniobacterales bacterium]